MPGEMTDIERRVKYLESEVLRLQRALDSVKHTAGAAYENTNRPQADDSIGRLLVRGQSVGVIQARTANTPGTGTFRFLQLIDGAEYLLQPFADGDVTAPCVNDTGSATVDNEYLILAMVDGVWTAIVGDCATATPARAPDPPES